MAAASGIVTAISTAQVAVRLADSYSSSQAVQVLCRQDEEKGIRLIAGLHVASM